MRRAAAVPLSLAVVIAATGWLYASRGLLELRPRVGESLPLDELARHSSVRTTEAYLHPTADDLRARMLESDGGKRA